MSSVLHDLFYQSYNRKFRLDRRSFFGDVRTDWTAVLMTRIIALAFDIISLIYCVSHFNFMVGAIVIVKIVTHIVLI